MQGTNLSLVTAGLSAGATRAVNARGGLEVTGGAG